VVRERGKVRFKGWLDVGAFAKNREAWQARMQDPISLVGKKT